MVVVAWTAIAILGAAVIGIFGMLFSMNHSLNARMEALGARIDALGARLDARIDSLSGQLQAHIDRHAS
jgi:uncharacterized membrane protein